MDYTTDIDTLTAYKTRVENHEAERARAAAKIDTLLEQAKNKYGVSSVAELQSLLETKGKERDALGAKVKEMNAQLGAFFSGV